VARFIFDWPVGEQRAVRQVLQVYSMGLKDLREVWDKFIPNIRRRERLTFMSGQSPFGETWPALSPEYAAQKGRSGGTRKIRGGGVASVFRPILVRTGALRKAASVKGAPGQFIKIDPLAFTFAVSRLSGAFDVGRIHQTGGSKMPRRTWLGLKLPDDLIALQTQIEGYLLRLKGKIVAVGRGRA
jgi:hypothetical protein